MDSICTCIWQQDTANVSISLGQLDGIRQKTDRMKLLRQICDVEQNRILRSEGNSERKAPVNININFSAYWYSKAVLHTPFTLPSSLVSKQFAFPDIDPVCIGN